MAIKDRSKMKNATMRHLLENAEAVDVSDCKRTEDGDYILYCFFPTCEYFDAREEVWIKSIGKSLESGLIFASTTDKFYMNKHFECLFVRR